jgi:2-polyprenyl-3-methyl-5-hydroxy-6-metoxy-1,4-benzoquinol methylase
VRTGMVRGCLRMEAVPRCLLCGTPGTPLYRDLEDRLFGVPGRFHFSQCVRCGFVWLDPRPTRAEIPRCYEHYYTHEGPADGTTRGRVLGGVRDRLRRMVLAGYYGLAASHDGGRLGRWVGKAAGVVPALRSRAAYGMDILFLPRHGDGRLLDVGCGNGAYLARMRELGWRVQGVDVDPQAARIAARERGLPVFAGTLEEAGFPDRSFDAVTMNHVIEHLADPLAALRECYRVLSAGGYLALVTPNVESLGHWVFGKSWRGLEPPRHLCLWRASTLCHCVQTAGFRILRCDTRSAIAAFVYDTSRQIRERGRVVALNQSSSRARAFAWAERAVLVVDRRRGEEICLLARKAQEA